MMIPVEHLIRACVDDERMLVCAARYVDEARGSALEQLADERLIFIHTLSTSGRTLHHEPRATGSAGGALRVLLLQAWALAAGRNTGDALSACRQSQGRLERVFTSALDREWSHELLDVITGQQHRICAARGRLIGIQYGIGSAELPVTPLGVAAIARTKRDAA
jgi:hypothetical protein